MRAAQDGPMLHAVKSWRRTPGTLPARASSGMNRLRENRQNSTTEDSETPTSVPEVLAQYTKRLTQVKNFPARFILIGGQIVAEITSDHPRTECQSRLTSYGSRT